VCNSGMGQLKTIVGLWNWCFGESMREVHLGFNGIVAHCAKNVS
jgi:hypothetical protein